MTGVVERLDPDEQVAVLVRDTTDVAAGDTIRGIFGIGGRDFDRVPGRDDVRQRDRNLCGGEGDRHRRIARWTLPIWLYVSTTGVIVYLMLYRVSW